MNDDHKQEPKNDIEATPEDEGAESELIEEEAVAKDRIQKLRTELKTCREEKQRALEELQRAKAEYLNARKRIEAECAREIERAENAFIERLLPLCDSFRMAMSDTERWQSVDETWRTGVESINAQLQALLASYDVSIIDPLGMPFDPELHEAVSTREGEEVTKPDTVVEVLQYGYERKGTLIRPAKVIISK